MMEIKDVKNLEILYDYQRSISSPYKFPTEFETWKESLLNDVDGEERRLFKDITLKAADEDQEEAGCVLLQTVLQEIRHDERAYAFFHYFGLSCYARHGKLFEKYRYIEELLKESGFVVEHENVYYSSEISDAPEAEIEIAWQERTKGSQQAGDFIYKGSGVGGFEVHYVEDGKIAYLRWIYVNDGMQNQGLGSKCMASLKDSLHAKDFSRLDTDTALDNVRAQYYYEKNGFRREGITRSYFYDGRR